MGTTLASCLFALCALAGERPEDRVLLNDGREVRGHVVYEDDTRVIVRVGSREKELERGEVEGVDSVVRSLDVVLSRLERVTENDTASLLDLARYARDHKLPGESRLFAWAVLAFDPSDAGAHELLGHRLRGETWHVRTSGRSYRFEDLHELRTGWGHAWEFETTHYVVRTDLELPDAVRIALDLERTYRDLYKMLAPELTLRDVLVPLRAQVHAEEVAFPESAGNRRSYFYPLEETLFVNASGGYEPHALVHEAVHQFLWGTGQRQSSGVAVLPSWVDEGLAEYYAAGISGVPGRLSVSAGAVFPHHFREHREAPKPYKLGRILALDVGDFSASSNLNLKYAQAYTLVHYLMHGGGPELRTGFFDYLRSCWKGKASSTHFKKAVGVKERELQERWTAYVADHRG